jgi:hypothetical protein
MDFTMKILNIVLKKKIVDGAASVRHKQIALQAL